MLANPIRGQVGFVVNGAGYTLSFSVNALCALEKRAKKSIREIANELASPGVLIEDLRSAFLAGLGDHHPDLLETDAGDLMGAIGIEAAAGLIAETLLAAFPVAGGEKTTARPPKTRAGTGSSSTKPGAKQA